MPKMKTHSGTKKRFKRTKGGKLLGLHTSDRHEQKRRRPGHPAKELAAGPGKRVARLLLPNKGR
jgi:ribosomal protein L35